VAATVIDGQNPKEVAKDVAGFIRDGMTIEQVDSEYVKEHLRPCKCKESEQAPLPLGS